MWGNWAGLPALWYAWVLGLLLPLALAYLWKLQLPRLRVWLPLALVLGLSWSAGPLRQFAVQCGTAITQSGPVVFFTRAFVDVLPS
jgi:hypothetical protein